MESDDSDIRTYPHQCTVGPGVVDPCSALSEVTEVRNPCGRTKGVMIWVYSKTSKGSFEHSRTFYGVKSGDHVKNGLAFNFCPFCGVDHTPAHESRIK